MLYTSENTSAIGRKMRVFLNGIEQKNVYSADTKYGHLTKARLNESGRVYADENGDIATETLSGVVTVEEIGQ